MNFNDKIVTARRDLKPNIGLKKYVKMKIKNEFTVTKFVILNIFLILTSFTVFECSFLQFWRKLYLIYSFPKK